MRILSVFLHLSGGHNEQAPGHGHPTGGGVPRSRTVPPQEPIFTNALKSASTLELERRAKVEAERAAKVKDVKDFSKFAVFFIAFFSFRTAKCSRSSGRTTLYGNCCESEAGLRSSSTHLFLETWMSTKRKHLSQILTTLVSHMTFMRDVIFHPCFVIVILLI